MLSYKNLATKAEKVIADPQIVQRHGRLAEISSRRVVFFLFACTIFGYLALRAYEGVHYAWAALPSLAWPYLGMAVVSQFIGVGLAAWIWHKIILTVGADCNFVFNFRVFTISAAARKLPGTMWYMAGRLLLYRRAGVAGSLVVQALLWEMVSLTAGGFLCFLLSIGIANFVPIQMSSRMIRLSVPHRNFILLLIFGLGLLVTIVAIFTRWMRHALQVKDKIRQTIKLLRHTTPPWHLLALWVSSEAIVILLASGVLFFVVKAVMPSLSLVSIVPMLGALGLSVALGPLLVWMPADIGLKDGFTYLTLGYIMPAPMAALLVLSWRILVTVLELFLGGISGLGLFVREVRPTSEIRARNLQ